MNYYDYFDKEENIAGQGSIDEFIAEATRTDVVFKTPKDELYTLRVAKNTLINELFTCYEYLRERNLLKLYQAYRNGEDLPLE